MKIHKDVAIAAFRENTDRIINSSIKHELLASALCSQGLIDSDSLYYKKVVDPITQKANFERLQELTTRVRDCINLDPNHFEKFLTAIESRMMNEGEIIAFELKKSYNDRLKSKLEKEYDDAKINNVESAELSATDSDGTPEYFDLPVILDSDCQSERDRENFSASTIAEFKFFKEHPPQNVSFPPDHELISKENAASDIFESHYDTITTILSENKIEIPFATKLCEVGLIGIAERDEAIKIKLDPIMRSKVIVGAVSTMIRRGVKPDNLMKRFVRVITLKEFDPYFKDIIIGLHEKGYKPKMSKSINNQSQSQTISTQLVVEESSGNGDSISRQTTNASDEGYRKHLMQWYKKENPCSFNCDSKEWKYFDLISTEESVTEGNKSPGSIDLRRLPQNIEDPPRSLIIGPPGIGKSSLAVELCKRWSRKELLHKYEYVILLEVSDPDINSAKKLKDVIDNKEWCDKIESMNGRKCLFIIEGYDELAPDNKKLGLVTKLIKAKSLSEASLIVTSRPTYKDELSSYFDAKAIEITGFSTSGKDEYIEHRLSKQDAESFRGRFSRFPIMDECSSIPFYLAILVHLFAGYKHTCEHTRTFPNTLTKMYGALICELILQFAEKHPRFSKLVSENIHLPPGEFRNLAPEIYMSFLKLCQLSYKALINPNYALKKADDQESFNLVNEHTESIEGRSKYLSFLHSSIKEYLGAYYISRMDSESINNHWLNMKECKRFNLALQFLSGFKCISDNLFIIQPIGKPNDFCNFYTFRQLCEFDSNEVITTAFEKVNEIYVFRTWPAPSPGDFWCLGRIIALSACNWSLGFTIRHLQNCHFQMLQDALHCYNQNQSKSSIVRFTLALNQFNEEGLRFLFQISPNILSKTYFIDLRGNHLTSEAIQLLTYHINLFPQLKELLIHNNDISCHQPLIEALTKHKHITRVSFSNIKSSECETLMTKMNENLKIIQLWQLSSESVKTTIELIPRETSGSKLNKLEFHQSQVTRESIENLSETLPRSSITVLVMKNCNITSSTFPKIVIAAAKLCHLNLSDNCIGLCYAQALENLRTYSEAELIYEHNCQQIATQVHVHGHQNVNHGQHAYQSQSSHKSQQCTSQPSHQPANKRRRITH